MKWTKFSKTVGPEGTTITYAAEGTPFQIQSRKRHIPHAGGRSGTWDHTTYVVTCRGFDVKTFYTLSDAKQFVEGAK